jgi:hypothetical protein
MSGPITPIADPVLGNPPPALTAEEQAAATAAAQAALGTPVAAMTRADALAKIATLKGDPEFAASYVKGDAAAVKEFTDAHQIAHALIVAGPETDAELAARVVGQIAHGFPSPETDVGKDLLDIMKGKVTLTPLVHRQVEAKRQALMSDKAWVAKYMAGDMTARTAMTTICTILGTATVKAA